MKLIAKEVGFNFTLEMLVGEGKIGRFDRFFVPIPSRIARRGLVFSYDRSKTEELELCLGRTRSNSFVSTKFVWFKIEFCFITINVEAFSSNDAIRNFSPRFLKSKITVPESKTFRSGFQKR